jgi:hypothetical protein
MEITLSGMLRLILWYKSADVSEMLTSSTLLSSVKTLIISGAFVTVKIVYYSLIFCPSLTSLHIEIGEGLNNNLETQASRQIVEIVETRYTQRLLFQLLLAKDRYATALHTSCERLILAELLKNGEQRQAYQPNPTSVSYSW